MWSPRTVLVRLSDLPGVSLPLPGPIAGGKGIYQHLSGCGHVERNFQGVISVWRIRIWQRHFHSFWTSNSSLPSLEGDAYAKEWTGQGGFEDLVSIAIVHVQI